MTNKKIKYQPIQPEVLELAAGHGNDPEAVLEVLKEIQAEHGGLSRAEHHRHRPRPRHPRPSGLRHGDLLFHALARGTPEHPARLRWTGLLVEERASVDGWQKKMPADDWVVERSSCLGLCDRAPAVLVNDEQAGPATPRNAAKVCEGWRGVPTDYSEAAQRRTPRDDRPDREDRSRFD